MSLGREDASQHDDCQQYKVVASQECGDMPLFLQPESYVLMPLEATYQAA